MIEFDLPSGTVTETKHDFGGKNKARRLAKAVKKGKTAKAEKLAKKVAAKVEKLQKKGKTDKKRYAYMFDKLKEAGEGQMSIKELEEVEKVTEMATEDDPAFDTELSDAEVDADDGTKAEGTTMAKAVEDAGGRWIPFLPNWATIAIPVTITAGIIGWIVVPKFKGKK